MAESASSQLNAGEPGPKLASVPVGRGGKDRRASLVIKETAQLLTGLHQDADRSNALMAELEALLAAAQHASGQTQPGPNDDEMAPTQRPQFAAVDPIQIETLASGEGEAVEEGEEDEEEEEQQVEAICEAGNQSPSEPASTAPVTASTLCAAAKRRSSVVTFDGAALFGTSQPPAGGQTMHGPPTVPRAMSFSRGRAATTTSVGRSFTDRGNATLRHTAQTDVGGQLQHPQQHSTFHVQHAQQHQMLQPQNNRTAVSATASAIASVNSVSRRPSSTDAVDFVGCVQARRSSDMSYCSAGPVHSQGQVFVGTGLRDDSADGGLDALGLGLGLGHAGGAAAGGGGAGGGLATQVSAGGGGGRFMKILKGIFAPQAGDKPAAISSPATSCCGSPSGAAPSATGATLESALTHGALSSMAPLRTPSRGQIITRGSLGSLSFIATDPKRSGSVQRHPSIGNASSCGPLSSAGGAPSPLVVGRSSSIASMPLSPHALVPTPPASGVQPQLALRRRTSGSGGMGPTLSSGAGTPTALLSSTGSACLSPASPSTALYGIMASSAVDCRVTGGVPSRRSLSIVRGQM